MSKAARAWIVALCASLAVTSPCVAIAQTSGTAPPVAELLFREAHRQLSLGNVAEACERFAESHRLDPAVGTLLNLALCHETQGRFATAWAEYAQVATLAARAGQSERERFAREKYAEIEPKLARLVFVVDSGADANMVLDEVPLGPAAQTVGIPVDPGEHVVEVDRGHRRERQSILVKGDGRILRVDVRAISHDPTEAARTAEPSASSTRTVDKARLWTGIGLTSLGAASSVLTVVYAATSASRSRGADELRDGHHESAAAEYADQATLLRGYAVASGAVAATSVGVGLYFVLTSRRKPPPVTLAPQVSREGATLRLTGSF